VSTAPIGSSVRPTELLEKTKAYSETTFQTFDNLGPVKY